MEREGYGNETPKNIKIPVKRNKNMYTFVYKLKYLIKNIIAEWYSSLT